MVVVAQSRWTKIAWFIAKPWLFVGLLVALFGKVPLSEALDWDRFTHTRTFLGDYRIFLAFIVAYVVIIGVIFGGMPGLAAGTSPLMATQFAGSTELS